MKTDNNRIRKFKIFNGVDDEGIKLFVSKGEFAPELYDVPLLIDCVKLNLLVIIRYVIN